MRRFLAVVLSAALIGVMVVSAYAADRYSDVKSTNWAHAAIDAMSEKGIVKGYPDGSFKPNATVTYGEFIKMAVVTGTGEDVGNSELGNWAMSYYNEGIENAYFTKHDIPDYKLDREIPRSDMALIISSILGDIEIENYDQIQTKLKDVNVGTKREYDIVKVFSSGILTGYPDGTFRPDASLTRAEAATVIQRLMDPAVRIEETEEAAGKVLSTKERFIGDDGEFANWAHSSTSKLPISDVISNASSLPALRYVKYYEIIYDYPYTFSIEKDLVGGESMNAGNTDGSRSGFLITDKKAIQLGDVGPYYYVAEAPLGSDFPIDFDYIGFYNIALETMMLVPNPLR